MCIYIYIYISNCPAGQPRHRAWVYTFPPNFYRTHSHSTLPEHPPPPTFMGHVSTQLVKLGRKGLQQTWVGTRPMKVGWEGVSPGTVAGLARRAVGSAAALLQLCIRRRDGRPLLYINFQIFFQSFFQIILQRYFQIFFQSFFQIIFAKLLSKFLQSKCTCKFTS